MTWPERLNAVGLFLQLGGVGGIIVWYLARVHDLSEGGLPGKVARLLVRLRLRPPPQEVRRGPSARGTASVTLEDPPLDLGERMAKLAGELGEHRQRVGRWQRKHEEEHGAAAQERAKTARESEHNAAIVAAGSSAAILLGLLVQIAAAFIA